MIATAVATRISDVDVAAHQVAFQIWFTLAMAMDAMAIAAQAMIGNLLGAGDSSEAKKVGERAIVWSVGIGVVMLRTRRRKGPETLAIDRQEVCDPFWVTLMQDNQFEHQSPRPFRAQWRAPCKYLAGIVSEEKA